MIEDIHENETSDMIDILVADYWLITSPSDRGVSYMQFYESVLNHNITIYRPLCRIESRILLRITSTLETKKKRKSLSY